MGILKKITDEYFGDSMRSEEGKHIVVDGCRVKVPRYFEKEDFLKAVYSVLKNVDTRFENDAYEEDKIERGLPCVHCKNDVIFVLATRPDQIDKKKIDVDSELYKSCIDYIGHILKDVEICFHTNHAFAIDEECIVLLKPEEMDCFHDKDEDTMNTDIRKTIEEFLTKFRRKADISTVMIASGKKTGIFVRTQDEFFDRLPKTIIYAKEMREWWEMWMKSRKSRKRPVYRITKEKWKKPEKTT